MPQTRTALMAMDMDEIQRISPAVTLSAREERFLEHLAHRGRLTPTAIERLRRVQHETADQLAAVILKLGLLSEGDLASQMADFSELSALSPVQVPVKAVENSQLSSIFLRAHEVAPLQIAAELQVVCWDVLDEYVQRALEFAVKRPVILCVATRSQVLSLLDTLYPDTEAVASQQAGHTGTFEDEEIDRLKDLASEAPVIRLVQRVINAAVVSRASDIHFEPSAEALHVRFRTDGLLRQIEKHPIDLGASMISRIKVMAGLNIAERRLPQDGRIRVTVQGTDIDFRVATSPTLFGESVVLRILDRQDVALDFDALGFDDELQAAVRAAIARPYGIILSTGPTGSGKTTTLYASLKQINTPDKKILTVEDPVEYVLPGVNQVPIKPQIGLSFANALRAFLRQDPDVLMVGEIRDRETAEIAIQAALTGHLLLSTLHTNTAAAAITRLLDMGIDDYLLTSTLHLILGQRLVRRLCVECREPYTPPASAIDHFGLTPASALVWYRAKGCVACLGSGYRGRTTIVEALSITDPIRAKVLQRADANEIEKAAVENGMRTLFQHGVKRTNAGLTSIEEVLRVTSISS